MPTKAGIRDVEAGPEIQKIGLSFKSLPPESVVVQTVAASTWGEDQGIRGGQQIVAINGVDVATMTKEEFKAAIKVRPMSLRLRLSEDPDEAPLAAIVAGEEVDKLGMSFLTLPPEPVVVNKVASGGWAESMGIQRGEEIVIVNAQSVAAMSSEDFKAELRVRPLVLRFQLPEEEADEEDDLIQEIEVGLDVGKIGLSFHDLPPQAVVVNKVAPETWAEAVGFLGGEEILALNDEDVTSMTSERFKSVLKSRPLLIRFRATEFEEVVAGEEVTRIGLSFKNLAPEPVVVNKVAAGTWAATVGFRGGEEIAAINGIAVAEMSAEEFKAMLQTRPLALRIVSSTVQDPDEMSEPETYAQVAKKLESAEVGKDRERHLAATKIQSQIRGKRARREVENRREAVKSKQDTDTKQSPQGGVNREQELAATKIQSQIRGKQARREVEKKKQEAVDREQELAATKIQSRIRGKQARREVEMKREAAKPTQDKAAKPSQQGRSDREQELAATKIQSQIRGKQARREVEKKKQEAVDREQELAATKIQSRIRGKQARREVEMKREAAKPTQDKAAKPSQQGGSDREQELAATKIQSQIRGKQARREAEKKKQEAVDREQELAATKIQSRIRGKQARREVEMKREAAKSTQDKAAKPSQQGGSDREQELAATKIQSQIRGKQARREAERKKQEAADREQERAATTIQSRIRGKQARREAEKRKEAVPIGAGTNEEATKPGKAAKKRSSSTGSRSVRVSIAEAAGPQHSAERAQRRRAESGKLSRSGSGGQSPGRTPGSQGSDSDRSPSAGRKRSSLEAGLSVSFVVHGLIYERLVQDVALMVLFEGAVKIAITQQVASGLLPEHIQLRTASESIRVTASLSTPSQVAFTMLRAALSGSAAALCEAIRERLAAIPGLEAFRDSGEDVTVSDLELQLAEGASRAGSIDASSQSQRSPTSPRKDLAAKLYNMPSSLATPATPISWLSEEFGGATSSRATTPSPRHVSPKRSASAPNSARVRPNSGAALRQFRAELLRREGTFAAGWRRILDSSGTGFVTHAEFCEACRRLNYRGNIRDAWHELDADCSGKATLCELDWPTAELLGRFAAALGSRFGGVDQAARQWGLRGGKRLRREEFRSLLSNGILDPREADSIFRMICCHDTQSRPSVRAEDLGWVQQLSPSLPRAAANRVEPGMLAMDQPTESGFDFQTPGELPPQLDSAPESPVQWGLPEPGETSPRTPRSPRSASQPLPRSQDPPRDDRLTREDLYARLYREAKDFHKRKQEKHEKEGLFKKPDPNLASGKNVSTAYFERLYNKGVQQKLQQEEKRQRLEREADELYRKPREPRREVPSWLHKANPDLSARLQEPVWTRLQKPREPKREEPPPVLTPRHLTVESVSTAACRADVAAAAADRLYSQAQKKKERQRKKKDAEDGLESIREKKGKDGDTKLTQERQKHLVLRLHHYGQEKQREAMEKREEARKAAEEEVRRLADRRGGKGKVRPATFLRLHLDGHQREEALAERRRMKEMEEEHKLKAESIHCRAAPNPDVFKMLHSSYRAKEGRIVSKTAEDAAEDGNASDEVDGSEHFDTGAGQAHMDLSTLSRPRESGPPVSEGGSDAAQLDAREPRERRRSTEEDRASTLQELREVRRSRLAMNDWMEKQKQELKAGDDRVRTPPGRTPPGSSAGPSERPSDALREGGGSEGDEKALQALLQRRPGSVPGGKRRSVAASLLSKELFGSDDEKDEPLPAQSSLEVDPLWGAVSDIVSWKRKDQGS